MNTDNYPNPKIGDTIEVVTKFYPELTTEKLKVISKGHFVNPRFNSWIVRIDNKLTRVSYSPIANAFCNSDA